MAKLHRTFAREFRGTSTCPSMRTNVASVQFHSRCIAGTRKCILSSGEPPRRPRFYSGLRSHCFIRNTANHKIGKRLFTTTPSSVYSIAIHLSDHDNQRVHRFVTDRTAREFYNLMLESIPVVLSRHINHFATTVNFTYTVACARFRSEQMNQKVFPIPAGYTRERVTAK